MTRPPSVVAFAFGLLPFAAAQDKSTPAQRFAELQANLVKDVTEQLRSDDLVTVAWGAHAAAEFRLVACIPDLRSKLVELPKRDPVRRRPAAFAILDALIQTHAVVPGTELEPFLEGHFLEPAIVLLCRRIDDNRPFLLQAFRKASDDTWRACGNVLADAKNPEFVLELLRTPAVLTVLVADPGEEPTKRRYGPRPRNLVGWRFTRGMQPEGPYPPTAYYSVLQQDYAGAFLLAPGAVPTYVLRVLRTPAGSAYDFDLTPRRTTQTAPTHWLAKMLGPDANPTFYDFEHTCVCEWRDPATFLAAVQERKAELVNSHHALIAACVARKLLTAEAAATVTPAVEVRVEDSRTDQSVPVPETNAAPKK